LHILWLLQYQTSLPGLQNLFRQKLPKPKISSTEEAWVRILLSFEHLGFSPFGDWVLLHLPITVVVVADCFLSDYCLKA
jgi:hypothetical protein